MKATLIRDDTETLDSKFVLDVFPVTLGRGNEADICIIDRWVSQINCQIERVDDALLVRDLNSAFGTLVNGKHITEARLEPGDKLTVGMSTFVVSYNGRLPELSATAPTLRQQQSIVDEHVGATLIRKHPK